MFKEFSSDRIELGDDGTDLNETFIVMPWALQIPPVSITRTRSLSALFMYV